MSTDMAFRPAAYWPADDPPEDGAAIATVLLESTLSDALWVRAVPDAGGIRYEVCDEYETDYTVTPMSSTTPLSLEELIALIDTAEMTDEPEYPAGLVRGALEANGLTGSGDAAGAAFVRVVSDVYPGLAEHYRRQTLAWVMGDPAP